MKIITLNDYSQHLTIECDDNTVHVMPLSLLRDVAHGRKESSILTEPVVRAIIKDFIDQAATIGGF